MQYGQFCPIAKATELLGDRWTLLIIRELLVGARRFSVLQRGLGTISPALLTSRLKTLADHGLIVKRKIPGQKGFEYFPTSACEELQPILHGLGDWGIRWAKEHLVDEDYDVELLMLYLERTVATDKLPGPEITLRFEFDDLRKGRIWWLVVQGEQVDVCVKDPGRDVDMYFTSSVRTMTDVWLGHRTYREAVRAGDLKIAGPPDLTRTVHSWLRCADYLPEDPEPAIA
ncbi:MAG: helix-turn-helix domain-containing protein [Pseudomonadota bacterium]